MSAGNGDPEAGSIYEKFKENTQKIFNQDTFKEGLDKGYRMLESRQKSKNSTYRRENKVHIGFQEF